MQKSYLAKTGDKIKFQVNVPMKESSNYQKGILYDGVIIEHHPEQLTRIEFIGDNKEIVKTSIFYDCYSSGMESFEIIISEEELQKRKEEWLANAVKIATDKYNKQLEFLNSVTFD